MPDASAPVKRNTEAHLVASADFDDTVDPWTTIIGATHPERTAVFEALDRFSALPGALPPLENRIHEEGGCRGHSGLFRTGPERWQIDLCEVTPWVILHEMGHAWTALHLTDQQRREFSRRWGLESWHDPDTPWRLRGAEHAADTIAWGLLEEPVGCHLPNGPIAHRLQAFRQLTAVDSPRVRCATPPASREHNTLCDQGRTLSTVREQPTVVVEGASPLPYKRILELVEVAGLESVVVAWVDTGRGPAGRARQRENLVILSDDLKPKFAENLLAHELAHLLTVGHDHHNQEWCHEYQRIGEAISEEAQQVVETHLEIRYRNCWP